MRRSCEQLTPLGIHGWVIGHFLGIQKGHQKLRMGWATGVQGYSVVLPIYHGGRVRRRIFGWVWVMYTGIMLHYYILNNVGFRRYFVRWDFWVQGHNGVLVYQKDNGDIWESVKILCKANWGAVSDVEAEEDLLN